MIGPYMVDSAVIKQYKGDDKYGTPSARTSVTVKCRLDYKMRQVKNLAGEIVVSSCRILLRDLTIIRSSFSARAATTIAYEDLFTFDGVDHAIILIGRQKDFSTRCMEVYVA